MTSDRACISLSLWKTLVLCFATLLAAPAVAQGLSEGNGSGETSAASPPALVDPAVWGVLATLAGNRWQTADGVVRAFEWSSDRRELVESELLGGLPKPMNLYRIEENELVQRECLLGLVPCKPHGQRFGVAVGDDTVVFKEIKAISKKNAPSVALRERPAAADWSKWKRKYLFIGETLVTLKLVGAERLEVTTTFSSKTTSDPVDGPWDEPIIRSAVAYSRAGVVGTGADQVATANFGPMETFVGKRMISEDLGEIIELQHQSDGSMAIQWFSLSGQPIGRYVFAAGAGGELELRDYPYVNSQSIKMTNKSVTWQQGGVLMFLTKPEATGQSMLHQFSVANGKLRSSRSDIAVGNTLFGKPKLEGFSSSEREFILATPELIAEAVAANERRLREQQRQAQLAAEERREREADAERSFASFMGGLNTFANAYNDAMAESRANEARQQAFLDDLRVRTEEIDRRRVAQQQAETEAPRSAPAEERARAVSETPKPAASVQQNQDAQSRTAPSRERKVSLIATPEAIVVCTHPDERGRFKCDTPLDVNLRGGPNPGDLWRTPQDYVAQADSCANARSLPSSTHLVWGCGYGATNGGNTMDRSAGVDVKGRNTYYCVAREWPCRRTTPE